MFIRILILCCLPLVACDKRQNKEQPKTPIAVAKTPAANNPAANSDAGQGASVKPTPAKAGLNTRFLDEKLDVSSWVKRFEGESREVSANRKAIVTALDLRPGQDIADVGAGTGLFIPSLAAAVTNKGTVYAVDISPRFLDHLRARVKAESLTNVKVVKGTFTSIELPKSSVDVVFICDTYHHFEQPQKSLASIHAALRPGGSLVIIDFEKIPGKTREWLMKHVRADRQTVRKEIEAAGFVFAKDLGITALTENYAVRFTRK